MFELLVLCGFVYLLYKTNVLKEEIQKLKDSSHVVVQSRTSPSEHSQMGTNSATSSVIQESRQSDHLRPETTLVKPASIYEQKTSTPSNNQEMEFKLGGKVFTWVGAVAVILGIGFLLQYAFENNWITPGTRIFLGVVAGALLIGLGEYTKNKFAEYASVLTGTGLGLWYLSAYASYALYAIFPQPIAFLGMILVTSAGIILAIRYDSMILALFAQIGGFLTPLVLSQDTPNEHTLFAYIALLDCAVLAVALKKIWRPLAGTAIVGTVFIYMLWFANSYTPDVLWVTQGYATLFFLIFFAVSYVRNNLVRVAWAEEDTLLVITTAVLYFLASYILINPQHHTIMGGYTAGLALVYFVGMFFARTVYPESKQFQMVLLGVGLTLTVLAVPIQFERFWITTLWFVEGLLFLWLGLGMRSKLLRTFGYGTFWFAFGRLVTYDFFTEHITTPFFNTRLTTSLIGTLTLSTVIYLLMKQRSAVDSEEYTPISSLIVEGYVIILWALSLEIIDFYPHNQYMLPVLWSIGALGIGSLGVMISDRIARLCAYGTFAVAGLHLLLVEFSQSLNTYSPLLNTRAYAVIVSVMCVGVFLKVLHSFSHTIQRDEYQLVTIALGFGIHFYLWLLMNTEIHDYYTNKMTLAAHSKPRVYYQNLENVSLSVAWTLYAVALLIIGIVRRTSATRITSIALFGIVIFKVFLYDTSSLDSFYRFIAFITLGLILLFVGYLYNRYKDRILKFIQVESLAH